MRLAIASMLAVAGCMPIDDESDDADSNEETGEAQQADSVCLGDAQVYGIDVSYYQGDIDWNAVAGAGYKFAITRINDGDFMDPKFDENYAAIREVGMIRGAYQFFRPGSDVATQAQIVIDKVGKLGVGDLPVTLDVEATDGVGPAAIADKIGQWIALVEEATGKPPIIYTGKYFWQDNVASDAFADYPLWHAAYPNACLPPADPPPSCSSCPNLANQWSTFLIWQYTSTGGIPGIPGNVDKDVFNGSEEDLIAFASQGGYGATLDYVEAPETVLAGESFEVRLTYTNSGGVAWDASTKVGTTEPRDRPSDFHDASWAGDNRPAVVEGAVDLGQSYTFTFTMKAPQTPGAYVEHFGLVEEGVAWFADQGGPADAAVELPIQVIEPSAQGGSDQGGAGPAGGSSGDGGGSDVVKGEASCECRAAGASNDATGMLGLIAFAGIGIVTARRAARRC